MAEGRAGLRRAGLDSRVRLEQWFVTTDNVNDIVADSGIDPWLLSIDLDGNIVTSRYWMDNAHLMKEFMRMLRESS